MDTMRQSFSRAEVLNMLSDLSERLSHDEIILEEIDKIACKYGLLEPVEQDDDEPEVGAPEST